MDRIRKWVQQIPIPAAFVLCGMAALLCALSLTRATMWFAQKNKGEIAAGYAEAEVTTPSMEAIPEQEQQPNFVMLEPEPGPSREALPKEEASTQNGQQEQEQEILMYIMPANIPVALPEEEKKKYDFYENLDNMAASLW